MKIFNTSHFQLLKGSGLTQYLVYAVGEIVLVVFGILIAVTINNDKENLTSKKRLSSYLQVYNTDLQLDTLWVSNVLKIIEERNIYYKLFLSDSLSAKTYAENPQGYGLVLSYTAFKLQKKGIGLLENYVYDSEFEQNTPIFNILANHRMYANLINTAIEHIGARK